MSTALASLLERLADGPLAPRVESDAPLGARTTYRVGGRAAALVTLHRTSEADVLAAATAGLGVDTVTIGRGSNLLVSDDGFSGLVVVLAEDYEAVSVEGRDVHAGAAAKLPVVARATVNAGLTGFEWAVGVPGSVGGAVRMNAGGHGAEIVDSIVDADIANLASGEVGRRPCAELALAYRSSSLTDSDVVLAARFSLDVGDVDAGKAEVLEIVQWRRENQPGGQNAGSVFTNPPDDSAGRLIDTAGLKGLRMGTAMVSEKHANFIQADPDGRAADVLAVMRAVRDRVAEHHGVDLHAETHLIGFPEDEV
ncbi:MAG: UDP-N-acetylmuramate dehydrogenase [Acidimicrobiales bacterium]|jgi:UDP-N-acetylmuramate dehydrogenase|nr:UDP-N-acetylmuramate dehydrogenase [Acidimicrobiales bacterium]